GVYFEFNRRHLYLTHLTLIALSPASGTFIGATQRVVDVVSLIIAKLFCKVKSKLLCVKN
ncbi:hypothetical protein, partial [Klebsiella variicola]|uniref:hypothetical protein n=1 Tax=Klebsiella variicola TaxID=244366 RepID=UPI00195532A0